MNKRIIMHIDVNSAFLSWMAVYLIKKRKHDIRLIPSVIAGDETKRRGIVLAKSIPAKKLGIESAETLYSARKKCKNLEIYPPNYNLFKYMSNKLFELIKTYTDDIEIVSVDECFLDYGKVKNLYGDEIEFAYKLKNEIYKKLGFTVNIGIANNKLCAKMASDFEKPNKVHTLFENEVKSKMFPLPIEALYGVGKSTSAKLRKIGVNTIEDLANIDKDILYPYFKNQTNYLINIANGIDDKEVVKEIKDHKCLSISYTLLYDYNDIDEINNELDKISLQISNELKNKKKYSNNIGVIIKDKYFNVISRQVTLVNRTNDKEIILSTVKKLFKDNWNNEPVRLIGIKMDNLSSNDDYQISIFENIDEISKDKDLEKVLDKLKNKYGENIIKLMR